jgi:hypothetical protein
VVSSGCYQTNKAATADFMKEPKALMVFASLGEHYLGRYIARHSGITGHKPSLTESGISRPQLQKSRFACAKKLKQLNMRKVE